MPQHILAAILGTLSALSLGVQALIIRKTKERGNVTDAVMGTLVVNFLLFFVVSLLYYPDFGITPLSLLAFAGAGLFGSFLVRILYFSGIGEIGASRTSPILKGDLVVASLIAIVFLGELITLPHLLGIFVLFVGISLVNYETESDGTLGEANVLRGVLLALGAMVFSGLSRPIAKFGLLQGTPPAVGLTVKFGVALGLMSVYFRLKGRPYLKPFRSDARDLYLGAGITGAVGMGLLFQALDLSTVVVVMPFYSLVPLFILVFSYFYMGKLERINWLLVSAVLLVVLGAAMVSVYM